MAGLLYKLASKAVPDTAKVVAFKGTEGIQEIYCFEVGLILKNDEELDCAAAIGERATLEFDLGEDADPYVVHGTIARVDLLHSWAEQTLYRAVLVPLMWSGTLNRRSFVFVDQKFEDVAKTLLGGWTDLEHELRLNGSYPKYEHIVRYQESTVSFLSRRMERDGMYFFFEHGDAAEKLVVTDDKGNHGSLRTKNVRYVPGSGRDHMALEAFDSWCKSHSRLVKSATARDFDELNPQLDIAGTADVQKKGASYVNFIGSNSKTADEAKAFAQRRAEERLAHEVVFHGAGRVFNLRSGYTFTLEGHPRAEMNIEYLVTRLVHQGVQAAASPEIRALLELEGDDEYRVSVTAIPAATQYRPPSTTPVPRIHGVERGWVDGAEESEYAQIDEHGRYRVFMSFDETPRTPNPPDDGKYSFWVRMLQPHAGNPEGFHLPLRKRTEVAVCFLGGDPDRPVICGSVPDAENPSPVTKDNHTLNVIQTGGQNRFEMQDEDGKQYIDISTPPEDTRLHLGEPHDKHSHYIVLNTNGDCLFNVGGTRDIEIGGDQNEHVAGDVNEKFDGNQTTEIGGDHTLDVSGSQTIDVGGSLSETVTGNVSETYSANQTTDVSSSLSRTIGSSGTYSFGGSGSYKYGGTLGVKTGGAVSETFGGAQTTVVSGSHTLEASGSQTFTLGGSGSHTYGGGFDATVGGSYTAVIGGSYTATVAGACTTNAPTINLLASTLNTTGASDASTFGAQATAGGAEAKAVGAVAEAVGAKVEVMGVHSTVEGAVFSMKGLFLENDGCNLNTNGADLNFSGITTFA